MRHLRAGVAVVVAFFVQTVALPLFGVSAVAPDFILATAAAAAFCAGAGAAIGFGVLAGLLQDSFSGGLLGLNGFSKPLVAFAVARFREDLGLDSAFAGVALLSLAAIADGLILWGLGEVTGTASISGERAAALGFGIPLTVAYGRLVVRFLNRGGPGARTR